MTQYRIRYKGLSDVRAITVEDAKQHGVTLSSDLVWDRYGSVRDGQIGGVNRPKFPNVERGIVVEGLSDELLKVLRAEGTFTVSEVKEDLSEGEEIITGEPLDDTGTVIKDATTGHVSASPDADTDAKKAAKKA